MRFHKNFQLNNNSFSNTDELLAYSKDFSDEIYSFLENWFFEDHFISVQTSGSTGVPKKIMLQKEYMINSALATGTYFNLQENTTALLCLPPSYIAGKMMIIRALVLGWKLDVIVPNSNPLQNITKQYDFSAMVPLQLQNSMHKLNQIKKLIVGGGVVSSQLENKLQKVSTEVFATYGMTETCTHVAVKKLNNFTGAASNEVHRPCYQTLPNVTIYKEQRNCLVIDAPKVASQIIFTNDVVTLISDTQFEWLGRYDTIINSGGVKLHPEKIEEKFSKIIQKRFFVAGLPNEKLGEKLILVIELDSDYVIKFKKLIKAEIIESTLFSKFEIPKEIYFVDVFIETETGKIHRKKTLKLI